MNSYALSARILLQMPVNLLERAARMVEIPGYHFTLRHRENSLHGTIRRDFADARTYECEIMGGDSSCTCGKSPCRHVAAICLLARNGD